ncbi:hypothetical protein OG322_11045 [Streptomyces sp. NBC_01260]|uniref:hypothetical protein n=1 Tax=unclassified Streptomyces TaxID=2593676 RepID=UPI000F4613E8|nr:MULTISPECIES: hypothetical protein [unclassified Streptomyces]MCX4769924.1 hypothetical protein [Streptomyces sp. NBC_01285]ROQ82705.1 hypothetical protein EDD95_2328 [Streptomyces sp. CEV 2-1]RPK43581.1 hypothetical protein EES39_18505 [Streptomyces sp. ADI92-24]
MNTFLNLLGISAVFALVLLPALIGIARERRIDRELREAERGRRADPPRTADAARPVKAARRPYVRSWARI